MSFAYKWFSSLASVCCIGLGAAWALAPVSILSLWGVDSPSTDAIVEHRFGALFLGIGVILLLSRNAQPSSTRLAISCGIVSGCLALLAMNVHDLLGGRLGLGILPGMGLQILMIVGFAYAEWSSRSSEAAV